MKKLLIFISVLFALPVYAQNTRVTLQSDNNATFFACGTHCITGSMIQNWNNLIIQSFGVLQDKNTWSGLNNFTGGIEINGIPSTLPVYQPEYNQTTGLGSAANYGIGTSGASLCLLNSSCIWVGQQQFGSLYGTSDTYTPIMSGIVLNAFPSSGTLGPIYGQLVTTFSGGASTYSAAPVVGATRGYSQVGPNVDNWVQAGVLGVTDDSSNKPGANSLGGLFQANSWHDGAIWGTNAVVTENAETFIATAGQTIFTLAASSGQFGQGTSSVVAGGTTLALGVGYTETCVASLCTGITLSSGATSGEIVTLWRGTPRNVKLAQEIDMYIGPGLDNFNTYTGSRIGDNIFCAVSTSAPSGSVGHCGSGIAFATQNNAIIDAAINFSQGFRGGVGFEGQNAVFSKNAIHLSGVLSDGQNIGIGTNAQTFAIEATGNSTSMPAGVASRWVDSTSSTMDVRCGAFGALGIAECGAFSSFDFGIFAQNTMVVRLTTTAMNPGNNTDNSVSLGSPSYRWSNTYTYTASIKPVAIASLPACTAAANLGQIAFVNNGIASPTYHQTVSTTGGATWPVYCTYNGTTYAWVY